MCPLCHCWSLQAPSASTSRAELSSTPASAPATPTCFPHPPASNTPVQLIRSTPTWLQAVHSPTRPPTPPPRLNLPTGQHRPMAKIHSPSTLRFRPRPSIIARLPRHRHNMRRATAQPLPLQCLMNFATLRCLSSGAGHVTYTPETRLLLWRTLFHRPSTSLSLVPSRRWRMLRSSQPLAYLLDTCPC